MNNTKMILIALFSSVVAVGCTAESNEPQPVGKTDYSGLFETIGAELEASSIRGTIADVTLPLPSGATVAAELETKIGTFVPGRFKIHLHPDTVTAIDANGAVTTVSAEEAGRILNDPAAQPVCGEFKLTAFATLVPESGPAQLIAVSLASDEAAFMMAGADKVGASSKGCKTIADPGLKETCEQPEACSIGLLGFEKSGKCDGFEKSLPDLTQLPTWQGDFWNGYFVWPMVPMLICYCNTTK